MREETELEKKFVLTCVFSRPWLDMHETKVLIKVETEKELRTGHI